MKLALFAGLLSIMVLGVVMGSNEVPFTRAIYRPSSNVWRYNFTHLAEVGIDCYYGNGGNWLWPRDLYETKYGLESLEAAANNITYIAGPYYMQLNWDRIDFNYTRAVSHTGVVETHTPSPLDPTWWYLMVEEPALITANLSLHYPIWGMVWDMELYGHDTYVPVDYTYDNPSLSAFANSTNITIPDMNSGQRYFWLQDRGLLDQYHRWLEDGVYEMAKATADKVHAINPDFALGILYFEDAWFYWQILDAFMTPDAPVTGWNEQSYPGFRLGGTEGIDVYQQMWEDHGLNGKFIPALAALKPWDLLTHTEACLRQNEVLWIYLGNAYPSEYDPGYEVILGAIERYLYFNLSDLNPTPIFFLTPGVEARPYAGPGNLTSVFLTPYRVKEKGSQPVEVVKDFTMRTSSDMLYLGVNLTEKVIPANSTLTILDIPCLLYGLGAGDLRATEHLAMVEEVQSLLEYCELLGLGPMPEVESDLISAITASGAGSYQDAIEILIDARDRAYAQVMDELGPMIQEGLGNPRSSEIPLNLLRVLSNAEQAFEDGKVVHGETYLFSALRDWSITVPEHIPVLAIFTLIPPALIVRARPNRRESG